MCFINSSPPLNARLQIVHRSWSDSMCFVFCLFFFVYYSFGMFNTSCYHFESSFGKLSHATQFCRTNHSVWFEPTVYCYAPTTSLHITFVVHCPLVPKYFVELRHVFQDGLIQIRIFYNLVICNTTSLTELQVYVEKIGVRQSLPMDLYPSVRC